MHIDNETIRGILVGLPALLFSLTVHEFAHAWVATKLGDPTPEHQGRLTLSPMAHLDVLGSLVFPVLMMVSGIPVFGWARPVQFSPAQFTRKLTMWQGTALTASAGPLSNVLLATLSAVALKLVLVNGVPLDSFAPRWLIVMIELNILLAAFNIFPLPPLDGAYLIPERFHQLRSFLTQYSFWLFLGIFMLPIPGIGSIGSLFLGPVMMLLRSLIVTITGLQA